jgi:hypothetical protein
VRWHRDHPYPVAARFRAVLPSFRHLSDREVRAHSFKLSVAQELISRKAGFDNRDALREGVQTMTDTQSESLSESTIGGAAGVPARAPAPTATISLSLCRRGDL